VSKGHLEDSHGHRIEDDWFADAAKADDYFEKTKREMRKSAMTLALALAMGDFRIPDDIVWTKEDWRDLYQTLMLFKARLLKRHGR
jgi:hypothetical protein